MLDFDSKVLDDAGTRGSLLPYPVSSVGKAQKILEQSTRIADPTVAECGVWLGNGGACRSHHYTP